MKKEYKILSATAILGYGFPMESFEEGMKRKPDLIAADAGSTDPGPYYLGAGESFTDKNAVKRDLEIMIKAGIKENIPVIIGTSGGSGAKPHVDWMKAIIDEIVAENNLKFKMGIIYSDIEKPFLKEELKAGRISALEAVPQLKNSDIDESNNIVGQMGIEPIIKALDDGAQVIITGRAYDPTIFAAPAIREGYDPALSLHIGKILECASICAVPGSGSDSMFGYIGEDYFKIEPLNPIRKCTVVSVAAHTLYEKTNPYILPGPGGHLDLHECEFIQETDDIVMVKGTKFVPSEKYTVKLEGAKRIGYRTVSIAGVRDPIMIKQIDDIIEGVRERVADNFKENNWEYYLRFNIYGKDGVMGNLEPTPTTENAHELGIIIEAVADSQAKADTICASARSTMLHFGYPGRIATAGNLAFPYSPSDFHAGEVYEFNMYHVLEVEDALSLFSFENIEYK